MIFYKYKAFKSPDIARDFNTTQKHLWSISGWLNGLDVTGGETNVTIKRGAFIDVGVVVDIQDDQLVEVPTDLRESPSVSESNPLILYALANTEYSGVDPTFGFSLKDSFDLSVANGAPGAQIASWGGLFGTGSEPPMVWSKVQGVSIAELLKSVQLLDFDIEVFAGEDLEEGNAVYIDALGEAFLADSRNRDEALVVGLALSDADDGERVKIRTSGNFKNSSNAYSSGVGDVFYLDENGLITSTVPTSDIIIPVGIAASPDEFIINPDLGSVTQSATTSTTITQVESFGGGGDGGAGGSAGLVWDTANSVTVKKGTIAFNGGVYTNPDDYPMAMGASLFDGGATDFPTDSIDTEDSEESSTWYYIYAKGVGSEFKTCFSVAPPHRNRRSARIVGEVAIDPTAGVSVSNGNALTVLVDSVTSSTLTIGTGGTITASGMADLINIGFTKNVAGTIDVTAAWSTSNPGVKAFVVGGNKVAIYAVGNLSGSASAIRCSGNLTTTFGLDANTTHYGRDWKYIGSVRNDASGDIMKFQIGADRLVKYMNVVSRLPFYVLHVVGSGTYVCNVHGLLVGDDSMDGVVDFSSYVPSHSTTLLAFIALTSGSINEYISIRKDFSDPYVGTVPGFWDQVFASTNGGDSVTIETNSSQKIQAINTLIGYSHTSIWVSGYYDPR